MTPHPAGYPERAGVARCTARDRDAGRGATGVPVATRASSGATGLSFHSNPLPQRASR